MRYVASEDLRLRIDTLKIKANKRAGKEIAVLNDHTVIPLWNDVHGTLFEVWKSAIWNLNVTVDRDGPRGLISLISNEITSNKIDTTSRKTDESGELLIETIGDWLEC